MQFDYVRALPEPPTKIIANLPYHITTPLMWAFLEQLVPAKTDYMLLMVQLESAERIASPAGHRERSPLGITVEAMGSAEVVRKIPPTAFNPQPRVNSALIEIKIEKIGSWRTTGPGVGCSRAHSLSAARPSRTTGRPVTAEAA